ncbi:MAG: hypothetical protein NTY38_26725, partial [Acidobacteria bacterium]|nr:hypothetical protein [Acidobacteriota bacterium]
DGLAASLGITRQLKEMKLSPGEGVCVYEKRPLTFLYAPYFNPELSRKYHYQVFEAYQPADCHGRRQVK